MSKFLITADLQLGAKKHPRTQDFSAVLPQIIKIAKEQKIDAVILAGDIFDSHSVDPASGRAFRRFCDQLEEEVIPLIAVEGNHEYDKSKKGDGQIVRIESYSDWLIRPHHSKEDGVLNLGGFPFSPLRIMSSDWKPTAKIGEFLATLPSGIDILVLHQSMEGMVPSIMKPEVKLEQIEGKARVVCVGDIHITKVIEIEGTTVISPGSTELCSISEPRGKSVTILDYDDEARDVNNIFTIPLATREVLKLSVTSPIDLGQAEMAVREKLESRPLIYIYHNSEMKRATEEKVAQWREAGLEMIEVNSIASIRSDQNYAASKESAREEMEEILAEKFRDYPADLPVALDLWRNPQRADEIIDGLRPEALK